MMTFWVIVAIAMVVVELVSAGNLISIWFAIGAVASMIVTMISSNVTIQVIVFAIVSMVSLLIIRPMASKFLRGQSFATNADSLIGRRAVLAEAIDEDKWGLIRINGTSWSATTADQSELPKGTRVEIVAIEGVKLIVRKIKEN